jgi:hypothetical protein
LQFQPDLTRIHPSWLVRALQGEPDSVRATVAQARPELASNLETAFPGLATIQPTRPAATEALSCVLSLWTERLVGDVPRCDEDPPIVARLSTIPIDERRLNRVLVALGAAKVACLNESMGNSLEIPTQWRLKFEPMAQTWPIQWTDELRTQVRADLASMGNTIGIADLARLGVLSVSRLLTGLDPHRLRWVFQHLPYTTARAIRAHQTGASDAAGASQVAEWEQRLLEHAVRHGLLPDLEATDQRAWEEQES